MEYTRLGRTGLEVSRLALGMMSFGSPAWRPWVLAESDADPIIRHALDAGITVFDTADVYSDGLSEELLGKLVLRRSRREEIVVATKVYFPHGDYRNAGGLSRKHILDTIDGSLRRLGTDYVDLLQIHRWDRRTPIEETMQALHDVVRAGKARYLGASSMYAWQFAKAQYTAGLRGTTPFVSMQPHYNLLYREEEREMLPQCADMGVGVLPWSPLARGTLTRPWTPEPPTTRAGSDWLTPRLYGEEDRPVLAAVQAVAERRGVPMAQVALAWLLARPAVTAPIVGATKLPHLRDALAAAELVLDPAEIAELEAPYRPQPIRGPKGDRVRPAAS